MEGETFNIEILNKLTTQNPKIATIPYEDLPRYDLFLSQVIDYLNDKLATNEFTSNIIQNYIKNEVISKPEDGKKKGYTKIHLIQLILLSYMRPILTADEIKKVFKLAFNDINNHNDDIISWELTYKIFLGFQNESIKDFINNNLSDDKNLDILLAGYSLNTVDRERIRIFLTVMTFISEASTIKKVVQNIVHEVDETWM